MNKTHRIAIDSHKVRMTIIAKGDEQKTTAQKMGITPSTLSKRLKTGEMTRTEVLMFCHLYGVTESEITPDVPEVVEKRESEYNTLKEIAALAEKLDYINRNICELVDAANKITELLQ